MNEFNSEPGAKNNNEGGEPQPSEAATPEVTPEVQNSSSALSSDDKTMGMLCHLASFAGVIGIPFGNILGPLVLWMIKKDESSFVDYHGKESLNFQISVTIYALVSALLILVVIGFFALFAVMIFSLIVTIIAAIKANNGEYYRYPLCIRFIK